jgi:hypothetical protein
LGEALEFQHFLTMGQSIWLIALKKQNWTYEAPPTN